MMSSPLHIFGALLILAGVGIIAFIVWSVIDARRKRANDSYEHSMTDLERYQRDESLPGPPRPRRKI